MNTQKPRPIGFSIAAAAIGGAVLILVTVSCEPERAVTEQQLADRTQDEAAPDDDQTPDQPDDAPADQPDDDQAVASVDVAQLEDGTYYAAEEYDPEEDWINIAIIEVQDGAIVDAEWNAAPTNGGPAKLEYSRAGEYGMERVAESPWHEQAEATAAHLVETQDPAAVPLDDHGETDAITGATITVGYFFELASQALREGPVEPGPYQDGHYTVQTDEPGDDWHDQVHVTIVGGRIAGVFWNPIWTEDGETGKYELSEEGEYGMERASDWPWHEHADTLAREVVQNQGVEAIPTDEDGYVDGITGATIRATTFKDLVARALEDAEA